LCFSVCLNLFTTNILTLNVAGQRGVAAI
jgi:hypothetical protein